MVLLARLASVFAALSVMARAALLGAARANGNAVAWQPTAKVGDKAMGAMVARFGKSATKMVLAKIGFQWAWRRVNLPL